MKEIVQDFLLEMSEKFLAGDVDGVLNCLSLPTAIYFGDDMVLVRGRDELETIV